MPDKTGRLFIAIQRRHSFNVRNALLMIPSRLVEHCSASASRYAVLSSRIEKGSCCAQYRSTSTPYLAIQPLLIIRDATFLRNVSRSSQKVKKVSA